MSGTDRAVVVKNTFLEVGDHPDLLERSDVWRRQVSEPVKIYTTGSRPLGGVLDSDSELDDDGADVTGGAAADFSVSPQPRTTDSSSSTPLVSGASPKVLLLADTLPASRGEKAEDSERAEPHTGESHIDSIKNNAITKKEPPWMDVTTVMMRNLPNKYTQQMLLDELQDAGFRSQNDWDFFYLPMDHSNAANLGYCFINFVAPAMANSFAAAFQGKRMRRFNSNKTVVVMPASIQGYEKNYAYYASRRVAQVEDPQYRPLFLRQPLPGHVSLPASTAGKGSGKERGHAKQRAGKNRKGGKDVIKVDSVDMPHGPTGAVGMYSQWPGGVTPQTWLNPAAAHMAASQDTQARVCGTCNNECSAGHRFCAFCGSFIGGVSDQSPGVPVNMQSLRANAPTFVPGSSSVPAADRVGLPLLSAFQPPAKSSFFAQTSSRSPDLDVEVTDELDVMRGRQMLLAALKDMEKRENAIGQDVGASGDAQLSLGGLAHTLMPCKAPDTHVRALAGGFKRPWVSGVGA